jgi:amino acid transporter
MQKNVTSFNSKDNFQETIDLANIISSLIAVFLSLLGIIFLGLMVYSGYNWMTAGGEEEKVKKAQSTIKKAIIGLIITVSAYSISYFVFDSMEKVGSSSTGMNYTEESSSGDHGDNSGNAEQYK